MNSPKQNSDNTGRIQKKGCNHKNRRNVIKKLSKSDIKWFLEKVFVPIALVVIPLSPSAIALLDNQQPPTAAPRLAPATELSSPSK